MTAPEYTHRPRRIAMLSWLDALVLVPALAGPGSLPTPTALPRLVYRCPDCSAGEETRLHAGD